MLDRLIDFLQSELSISPQAICLAQKNEITEPNILPMILWQYGMLTLAELDRVLEWLEVF
jgi:Protein of unknown function (DUF2949)